MRGKQKVKIEWSPEFAYGIGLITTDGCLSSDGRHISLVSKDIEQLENFLYSLNIKNHIGENKSGLGLTYLKVQFSDVHFYRFLLSIGLMPKKSRVLGKLGIPKMYFIDFLRGHFDGDGSIYEYYDKRWPSSYLVYTCFVSASIEHINWLRQSIRSVLNIRGHITKARQSEVFQLKYAKLESYLLIRALYYSPDIIALSRKRSKAIAILERIRAGGETVYTQP